MSVIDGEGDEDRRLARMLSTITSHINNVSRSLGYNVPDSLYRPESAFMPVERRKVVKEKPQAWSSVASTLGFK